MTLLLIILVLFMLFGGGGYYGYRRQYYGGGGFGLIGLLLLILVLFAAFGGPYVGLSLLVRPPSTPDRAVIPASARDGGDGRTVDPERVASRQLHARGARVPARARRTR